jgi:hypothetical protein
MVLNSLTEDFLESLRNSAESIREEGAVLNHVIVKKEAIRNSLLFGAIGINASPSQKKQMQEFVDDLDFIEHGLKGHWVDVFTFSDSQKYYHALQKQVELIVADLK